VTDIRVQGRNTKGVKIMNIREKDKLVSLARIKKEE
jgi:DNA gyrase subunit A